ncbi:MULTISPECIES: 3-hydroxyacyl-CoA dehydrogenase family protein [Metallosphaera]|nr:3-hydroxyacyl-CoA dehydrogenase family protein [Metallosphaera cuprina]
MKIYVVGSGTMGSGIGQVFAMRGYDVTLFDIKEEALRRAIENIKWSLNKLKEKDSTIDVDEVMKRISVSTSLVDSADSYLVIEAVFEDINVKADVLMKVSKLNDSIIASNTSSLPISELSKYVREPERFLGMHFFNPPVLMKLVEVIRGDHTSDRWFNQAIELVRSINKFPLPVRKDVFGFVVNRVLFKLFISACSMLSNFTPEEIDYVAMNELGMPLGLIMLLDYTGLDVNYDISKEALKRGFDFNCPVLAEMVKQGKLGRKSGKGFYDWSKGKPEVRANRGPDPKILIKDAVEEARWLISQGVVNENELETGIKLGLGLHNGILELGKKFGL